MISSASQIKNYICICIYINYTHIYTYSYTLICITLVTFCNHCQCQMPKLIYHCLQALLKCYLSMETPGDFFNPQRFSPGSLGSICVHPQQITSQCQSQPSLPCLQPWNNSPLPAGTTSIFSSRGRWRDTGGVRSRWSTDTSTWVACPCHPHPGTTPCWQPFSESHDREPSKDILPGHQR